MNTVVDNILALRIIKMIVTPFEDTLAFKLGIIDKTGKNLIKTKDFTSSEQKNSYTLLHRLVYNIKKIINKLPGGQNNMKNIISSYFLIKESLDNDADLITEEYLVEVSNNIENIMGDDYVILEDIAANNASGGGVSGLGQSDVAIKKKKSPKDIFKRYSTPRQTSDFL